MRRALSSAVLWLLGVVALTALGPPGGALAVFGRGPSAFVAVVRDRPDQALVLLVGAAAWVLMLWLALGWLAVLGSAGTGRAARWSRRTARLLLPRVVRHGLEAALGIGVAVVTATPALAAPASAVPSLDRVPATSVQLTPVPQVPAPVLAPTGAATRPQPATPAPAPSTATRRAPLPTDDDEAEVVVVHRGDCLWSLVSRALGPDATDDDVNRAWPRWYAANRSVIGADPDLLLPGQQLRPPR